MWEVKFCAVVFLLLVFVPDADCWRRRRRRRYTQCSARNCQVSSWSEWSPCTHQCGTSGKQTRTRTITVHQSCGGSCPFVLTESRSCHRVNCENSGISTAVLATSTLQSRNSSSTLTTTQAPSKSVSTSSPFIVTATSAFATPSFSAANVTTAPMPVTTQPPFTACGGRLNGSSGSFASPGYPGFYSNNLNCLWTLFIPTDAFVTLQFVVFDTQSCCDFVELFDLIFGQRIDRLSGFRSGFTVTVRGVYTSSFLGIRFTTDRFVTKQGFKAQYSITFETGRSSFQPLPSSQAVIISPSLTIPAVNSQPLSVVPVASTIAPTPLSSGFVLTSASTVQMTTQPPFIACGGRLSESSGSFASPGYPRFYPNNLNCLWTLFIPPNAFVTLRFLVFDTELCCDFVELTDIFGQRIDRFSGFRSGLTVTVRGVRTPLLRIRFTTNRFFTERQGFLAQYSITFAPISSFVPAPSSSAVIATPTSTMQVATRPPPTVNPSASSVPPVVPSSSVTAPVTLPPDVQRALVDLLRSLVQIIQRLQALVGGSFSPAEFEDFRNQTLQILQQAENQLVNPSSSWLRNARLIGREIQEISNPQDLVQMLENIQRRLLG